MSSPSDARPFGIIERVSLWTSGFCLVGMTLLILLEVVLRGVFNSTTEHADELVGYLLVGVSFLSLALCQSRGAFHRVEMVQMRLGPRGKAVSQLVFDLLSFGYIALTDLYFLQFVMSSYRREAAASTVL
ncbi:MAG: TRAP transporter small permease, partial [Alphaproteobacteria bacterium]|nr:TRAP transporter small permease [Alphaproteobacteria bacterium]